MIQIDKQLKNKCSSVKDLSHASETVMLQRILDFAKTYYSKPENIIAFQKWLNAKNKFE